MSAKKQSVSNTPAPSRRDFLASTSAAAVGGTLVSALASPPMVHAAGSEMLKVGLIGCGGRGSSAALNAMHADENTQLTVLCDLFPDYLQHCKENLSRTLGKQFAVKDDHCFTGFDGYKKVMESDVDVVLLCTTPAFRPVHLKAALEAGKHVFCEKPVAVDAPGVRSCLQSTALASAKNLNLVSGLCWRYDYGVKATMEKILGGA
ncbi:MAG: Gfo/Idh/MocA family oxidoreductase, partial [Pirellulaceae bacterium]|nr:Gfo/Idh/MocA family oxidoreductase [Pirellulaceae bacterium]